MTARLELIIEAGKVEMRIHSSSDTEEEQARKLHQLVKKDVRRIKKKVQR